MDIRVQVDSQFCGNSISLAEGMNIDMKPDSRFGINSFLPVVGEMFLSKSEASSSCSNIFISDIASEQKELDRIFVNKFEVEQYYGDPVLNVNNGIRFEKDPSSKLQEFLQPDIDALQNVTNFNASNNSNLLDPFIKPVINTDQLVKLMYDQTPFYDSCRNIIIAQKPLDMNKGTGRMVFEMAELSLIDKQCKLKMFLRDVAANDEKILELLNKNVEKKHKCKCFAEHNNSLFCVRSRYSEAVQVIWSEEKSYAFINIEDNNKFELLFAPLISHSKLKKNSSSIIMQLVFQLETEFDVLEQYYFIKFLMSPRRDIDNFIKTLVKENYVDDSFLEEIPPDSSSAREFGLFKVEIDAKYEEDLKTYLQSIEGKIASFH